MEFLDKFLGNFSPDPNFSLRFHKRKGLGRAGASSHKGRPELSHKGKPELNIKMEVLEEIHLSRIKLMLKNYNAWVKEHRNEQQHSKSTIQSSMLHCLAKMAAVWRIGDNKIVAEILGHIFEADGHFSGIFHEVTCANHSHNAICRRMSPSEEASGLVLPQTLEENEAGVLEYFLRHSNLARLTFGSNVRMVDLSLFPPANIPSLNCNSVIFRPHLLLIHLRHGAFIQPRDHWTYPSTFFSLFFMRFIIENVWTRIWDELEFGRTPEYGQGLKKTVESASCLLMVIPQLKMVNLDYLLYSKDQRKFVRLRDMEVVIRKLTEGGVMPSLWRRYAEPSALKHLCRCVIRERLYKLWALPDGIEHLPLPRVLKDYLDLQIN